MEKEEMVKDLNDLRTLFLEAPEGQLDKSMIPLIEKWDQPPKAIQILEVIDQCVHAGLASDFVVMSLTIMMGTAMTLEGVTEQELYAQATWREELKS